MIEVGSRIEVSRTADDEFVMYGDVLEITDGPDPEHKSVRCRIYPRERPPSVVLLRISNAAIYGPAPTEDPVKLEQWLEA